MARNTTAIGDALRDHVAMLLEAAGHRVQRETRIDTKKVDLRVEIDDEFRPRVVAVECKNLARTISQDELATIHSHHSSLVDRGLITEVWVVARRSFSADALSFARQQANFEVFTIAEFEERREGFRAYVRQVRGVFAEDGLDECYVRQRCVDGTSLSERVLDWIASADERPLALLGGYGMGKTSFCRHLVDELGRRYLDDPSGRVPVLVRLSDIAKEQDLDGLIAKTLAQRYAVRDYHFHKFQALNRNGKFVVVFDGFDEMKHALTWGEFKYNFSQINRVVEGDAKVIIAGRPNAFLSDDEHNWALRGVKAAGERLQVIPGAKKYIEVGMAPFTEEDARTFLRRTLGRKARAGRDAAVADAWVEERLAEFDRLERKADLLRPVHLKIFSDIAADPDVVLRDFSVHELYAVASDRIADRDAEKPQKAMVEGAVRRGFIEDVAWWLWDETEGRSLAFDPARVPMSIVRRAFPNGADLTDEAMQREVFSGSFIKRKHGGGFYFAHRSFLEFFVANTLSRAPAARLPLSTIDKALNPEILAFIREGGYQRAFLDHVARSMDAFAGELDLALLKAVRDHLAAAPPGEPRPRPAVGLVLGYLFAYEEDPGPDLVRRVLETFRADVGGEVDERREGALFFVADLLRASADDAVAAPLATALVAHCASKVDWPRRARDDGGGAAMPRLRFTRANLAEWSLLRSARVAAELDAAGRPTLVLDMDQLQADLFQVRRPRIVPVGREPASRMPHRTIRLPFDAVASDVKAGDRGAMLQVLRRGVDAWIGS